MFTDLFCGAGGSSIGLSAAGFELALAANHWDRAVETHAANFTDAEHVCADISNYDMRRLPSTDVLWASPICTEMSPAGGRRRGRGQLDLLEQGPVAQAGFEKTRATFMDVIRAAELHRYAAVVVENIVDVATDWELFDWWVSGMKLLGYNCQFTSVSSAHIGGAGNPPAPQWRDRLYLTLTRQDVPLPDVAPTPTAWCAVCGHDVAAVQSWRNPDRRRIGKYRQQYDYRCPNVWCRHTRVEPYVAPAAAAIDWSDLGPRIGDRAKPLAAATRNRIQAGLDTFTAGDGASGWLVPSGGTWRSRPTGLGTPMPARTTRDTDAVVSCPPFVTVLRNHSTATGVEEPLATVSAGGNHHGLATPPDAEGACSVNTDGGNPRPEHALVIPYRRGAQPHGTDRPVSTIATHEQHGLAAPDGPTVEDCRYRMLRPREQLRVQCFPDSYRVTGNQGEQTAQAGNAVSANVACWLGHRLATVL